MRAILLHYHILKNGGSTIEEIFRRSFGNAFCSFDYPDRDAEIRPGELLEWMERNPQLKAFSSHQIFYPVPKAPGFLFFDTCFLRDPFDRIRSIYDYFRSKPAEDDPIRLLAHRHSLRDFVKRLIEEMPWTVNDVQVNLLANGRVNDLPHGPVDLETATRRMIETSFLGVIDRFEESLAAGEYSVRTVLPELDCAQERVNTSARSDSTIEQRLAQFRRDCGADVFRELARLNAMDLELLRRARLEIRRRFDRTPGAEQRLRELKGEARSFARPLPNTIRPHAIQPENGPGFVTRWKRGLRFLACLRMSRPRSAFRRLFKAEYYGGTLWHFVTQGGFEGRNPHPLFDTNFYLRQCARPPRTDALSHYLKHGGQPHPVFDPDYYLQRYADVAEARLNPLLHYILHGAREGRRPNRWFDPAFYLAGCPEARDAANLLLHFLETAAANPHPLFDCASHARANPEAENPLTDFLTHSPQQMEASPRIEFNEVEIAVVLAESDQREIHERTGAAVVWLDARRQKNFLCDAHLTRFFTCVRYDQLAAQIPISVVRAAA